MTFSNCNQKTEPQNNEPAIDPNNMDLTIEPGNDFFRYVNGKWLENNPIPDEHTIYGAMTKIAEDNQLQLQAIVEEVSANTNLEKGSTAQKISDFYNSGMDSVAINEKGIKEIEADLKRIEQIESKTQLPTVIAEMNHFGMMPFFVFYPGADMKNASMVIANLSQGGMGLPDRDYYLKDDERSVDIQENYKNTIANLFVLSGENEPEAVRIAADIMQLETDLARVAMDRIERRDPNKTYHKMTVAELQKISPSFDWNRYFEALGNVKIESLNVCMPDFITGMDNVIDKTSLETIRFYLKWNVLRSSAPYLSDDFAQAHFDFYSKYLSGQLIMRPRWKRVLDVTSSALGELIGQLYVEKHFPEIAKERMITLVGNLRVALENRIKQLDWMQDETKKHALSKLATMNLKVGYPDKWIDYTALDVVPDSYFTNIRNTGKFEFEREIAKIDKPVDKDEWFMTPQTVNAYYSPTMNEIVFPAGILQPPFFNVDADDAVNYGAIGVVIGHEMTHGFDDQGCKYDQNGNLNNWWTVQDMEAFRERTEQLVKLFDEFPVFEGHYVNGRLTLGENIADLGGLMVSWDALQLAAKKNQYETIDGFSYEQRFFIGYAQIWRQNIREKTMLRRLVEDVHSPAEARVNRALFSMPEFYKHFSITPENKLYIAPDERASIW
jgi:putative endopeptidase